MTLIEKIILPIVFFTSIAQVNAETIAKWNDVNSFGYKTKGSIETTINGIIAFNCLDSNNNNNNNNEIKSKEEYKSVKTRLGFEIYKHILTSNKIDSKEIKKNKDLYYIELNKETCNMKIFENK